MVSARGPYADNWEQFFKKIRAYSPKQRKTLLEEAQIDPKLAMIHGLARQWVARNNDPIRRVQGRQARILEEREHAIRRGATIYGEILGAAEELVAAGLGTPCCCS